MPIQSHTEQASAPSSQDAVEKAAHTPTPWRVEENCLGTYPISAKQGPLTVQPAKAFGEADAAFIVKAVNSHDALVKALEFYASPSRYAGANQRNDINDPYSDGAPYIRDVGRDGGKIARDALYKINGA